MLSERLLAVMDRIGSPFEIIPVNDGSTDGSRAALRDAAARRKDIKVFELKRNSGQTAATMCGATRSRRSCPAPAWSIFT